MGERAQLEERIAAIPNGVSPKARRGYEIASTLSLSERDKCIGSLLDALADGFQPTATDIATSSALGKSDASALLLVISLTFALMIDTDVSVDEFIQIARDKLFSDIGKVGAEAIASLVFSKRNSLKPAFDVAKLGASILPSLDEFELEIDMRLRFSDGKLERSAPIVVVHIATDAEGEDLWMQLNKRQVNSIIEKLTKALNDLSLAEKLVADTPSKVGR